MGASVTKRLLLVVAGVLGVGSCTTSKATLITYLAPNFDARSVESLALLPSRNASLASTESRQMTRLVALGISERSPNVRIVDPADAAALLNDAGLAYAWTTFLLDYDASGILDAEFLRSVGDALDVDVVMQGEMVSVDQLDGHRVPGESGGGTEGLTRVTVRFTMLDTRAGRLLWEGTSHGIRKTTLSDVGAPPVMGAVELAVDTLISSMPLLGR